jgi:hypothetical protein
MTTRPHFEFILGLHRTFITYLPIFTSAHPLIPLAQNKANSAPMGEFAHVSGGYHAKRTQSTPFHCQMGVAASERSESRDLSNDHDQSRKTNPIDTLPL